ncbi:sulfotransferase [Saccharicrinis sp. FJH54]|uniref:sulfotransferase n=1 Tax=Saccharicrinis sp. FJH54 TaxID=3344665 RepID=UPI0035D3F767
MKRIAIHSVPRSGSSWLGSIFDSHPNVAYRFQPLFSYTHKSQLRPKSSFDDINTFFEDILNTKDSLVLQKEAISNKLVPEFTKNEPTHIVYKEVRYHHILENLLKTDPEIKVIGLVRNPCAVINSWIKAPKEFRKNEGWKIKDEWRCAPKKNADKPEEFNGFEKWKEVTLLFHKLNAEFPERFYLLKYDSLLQNTQNAVEQLFNFCDLEVPEQTSSFITASRSIHNSDNSYSVYRIKDNDLNWENELPNAISSQIKEELKRTQLEIYLKA